MKLVFGLIFLVLLLPLISESFSYFDADIINHHLDNKNNNFNDSESEIIQFNEFPNEQQVKRYLIFGKGSLSEINSFVQTPYSISSSNGFLIKISFLNIEAALWKKYRFSDFDHILTTSSLIKLLQI